MAVDDDRTINRTKNIIITVTCSQSIIYENWSRDRKVYWFLTIYCERIQISVEQPEYTTTLSRFFADGKGNIQISVYSLACTPEWQQYNGKLLCTNISHQSQIYIFCSVPFHNIITKLQQKLSILWWIFAVKVT